MTLISRIVELFGSEPILPRKQPPPLRRPEPVFPPEMIVGNGDALRTIVRANKALPPNVVLAQPTMRDIAGRSPYKVTVLPGVDLFQDVEGQGRLIDILRQRQLTWGDSAIFIDLTIF